MSDGVILLPPESERYRAELIFVHGLWVDSRIWRGIAAGFAHRGWSCVLVDRVSSSGDSDDSSWVGRVAHVAARREVLPIVIGHDAGALVALDLAARGAVRAAVAIAPLLEGASPLQSPSARLVRRLRGDRAAIAPPDPTHAFFAGIPDER
ncbi:alpha/beta fold hydrolase, partial [Candidatus Binatia bacterium]|nr:alpha/beta fold hydrolase [Candidatus Binatia bacterium]